MINVLNFVLLIHEKVFFFSLHLATEYVSFTPVYLQTCSECSYALRDVLGTWTTAVSTVDNNKPCPMDVMWLDHEFSCSHIPKISHGSLLHKDDNLERLTLGKESGLLPKPQSLGLRNPTCFTTFTEKSGVGLKALIPSDTNPLLREPCCTQVCFHQGLGLELSGRVLTKLGQGLGLSIKQAKGNIPRPALSDRSPPPPFHMS